VFGKKKGGAAPAPPAYTKIFFATDLHGSDRSFRKFVNGGKLYGADILVLGGDVTGKVLVPIVKDGNGGYRATVSDVSREIRTAEELEGMQELVSSMGYYYEVMDHETLEFLKKNPDEVEEMFAVKAR